MSAKTKGANRAPNTSPPESESREYLVRRDKDRPLSFAGIRLAQAIRRTDAGVMSDSVETIEAAVYKTRGGKFVTSLSKSSVKTTLGAMLGRKTVDDEAGPDPVGYNKGDVHETLEDAVAWFRPGRLTDEIRKQLGFDEPIRIE